MKKVILFPCILLLLISILGCGNPVKAYWENMKPYVDNLNDLINKEEGLVHRESSMSPESVDIEIQPDRKEVIDEATTKIAEIEKVVPPEKLEEFQDELLATYKDLKAAAEWTSKAVGYEAKTTSTLNERLTKLAISITYIKKYSAHWKKVGELQPDPSDL